MLNLTLHALVYPDISAIPLAQVPYPDTHFFALIAVGSMYAIVIGKREKKRGRKGT